ncbi:MAG: Uma2 family endonuclease [Thermomicrobiales bacterium]
MVAPPIATMTEAEYLAFERANEARHEYVKGNVYEMVGITMRHRHIVMNTAMSLHGQLRGTECHVLFTSMRIKIQATGMYAYPDIVAYCGKAELEDDAEDTLLNPTVLIEALSPATQNYDRSTKWVNYQEIKSLQAFLFVGHDAHFIEHYIRLDDRRWTDKTTRGLESAITLPTINCTLALADVYEGVNLKE